MPRAPRPIIDGHIVDFREPVWRVCDRGDALWFRTATRLIRLEPAALKHESLPLPFEIETWTLHAVWGRIAVATRSVADASGPGWHWRAIDVDSREVVWEHERWPWYPSKELGSDRLHLGQHSSFIGIDVVNHQHRSAGAVVAPSTGTLREESGDHPDPVTNKTMDLVDEQSLQSEAVSCPEGPGFRVRLQTYSKATFDVPGELVAFIQGFPTTIVARDALGLAVHFVENSCLSVSTRLAGNAPALTGGNICAAVVDGAGTMAFSRRWKPDDPMRLSRVAIPGWVTRVSDFSQGYLHAPGRGTAPNVWVVLAGESQIGLLNVALMLRSEVELDTEFRSYQLRRPGEAAPDPVFEPETVHLLQSVDGHGVARVRHPTAGELLLDGAECGGSLAVGSMVEVGYAYVGKILGSRPATEWRLSHGLIESGTAAFSLPAQPEAPAFLRLGLRKIWGELRQKVPVLSDPVLDRLHDAWDLGPDQRDLIHRALRAAPVWDSYVESSYDALGLNLSGTTEVTVELFKADDGDWGYRGVKGRFGLRCLREGDTRPVMTSVKAFLESRLLETEARGELALAMEARLLLDL